MPKFYYERITHRYVYEYYEVDAEDADEADEKYYEADFTHLGTNIGGRIEYADDGDELIEPKNLPSKYDLTE